MPETRRWGETELGLFLFAVTLAAFGLKYLLNLILARNLPPEVYGDLVLAFRVLGIAAVLALLGTGTSSKRFLGKYLQYDEPENVSNFLRWNTRLVARSFSVCVVLSVVSFLVMVALHLSNVKDIESYHLTAHMLWVAPAVASSLLLSSYLLCIDHPVTASTTSRLLPVALQVVLFATAIWIVGSLSSNVLIAVILLVSASISVLAQIVYIYARAPSLLDEFRLASVRPARAQEREWMRVSARLSANQIFYVILCSLDILILEIAPVNEAYVGYYGATLTIVNIVWLIPEGTVTPLTAKISSLIKTETGRVELQKHMNRALAMNFVIGSLIVVGISVFSSTLLSHFGSGYVAARPALIIGAFGALLGILARPATVILAYADLETELLRVSIVELGVLLVCGALLVTRFGMEGVATATVVAVVVKAILAGSIAKRHFDLKPLGIF
jgi:O-antigen/teichoic acid export membrane protein